jgi:hypothetical protein
MSATSFVQIFTNGVIMQNPQDDQEIPPPHQSEVRFRLEDQDLTPEDCGAPPAPDARSAPRSGASAPADPSLDTKCQNPTKGKGELQSEDEELKNPKKENSSPEIEERKKPTWDRKQKRAYHKSITLMKYWEACHYQVFFVTLTGSPTSNAKELSYHHERLKLSVVRSRKLPGLEHFKVITIEGHGVIHTLWAIPPAQQGFRDTAVFIPQSWLSNEWERIHGAKIVDIRRVTLQAGSQRRLSRYIVSQYCGGQSGFVRSDYTRAKWLGFSIRSTWERLKRYWRDLKYTQGIDFGQLCKAWETLVKTRICRLGENQFVVWNRELHEV